MKLHISALLFTALGLAGCQTTLLSDARIAAVTAGAIGVPEAELTISERRTQGPTNTTYKATTRRGAYSCVINGGSVLSAGIVNPPSCTRL